MNQAERFRALHEQFLVLANAWDAGSARLIESCGAAAIATTSSGLGWSNGYPDGSAIPVAVLGRAVAAIARVIAVPLTVCLAVIGRYVPSMRFLGVLLSDEEVLTPEKRFYQRLLAADVEEAAEVTEEFLKGKTLEEMDEVFVAPH
mgnify:CR=1 FL=1